MSHLLYSAARNKLFGFERSLYDELILLIFSWLPAQDLCAAQGVSRNWARLARDQQLWKALYLRTHGRERLRGSRGHTISAGADETRLHRHQRRTHKDWKWMFRVTSNWRSGRCTFNSSPLPVDDFPAFTAEAHRSHIIIADGMTFMASSTPSPNPAVVVTVYRDEVEVTYRLRSSRASSVSQSQLYVTALCVDQGRGQGNGTEDRVLRVVVFYSDSSLAIFSVPVREPASHSEYATLSRLGTSGLITHATYQHPLLVGLSNDFTLTVYNIWESNTMTTPSAHIQSLKSFTSFPPSSMVLSLRPPVGLGRDTYRLVLSYAVPMYPAHWSLGVTDLTITRHGADFAIERSRSVRASSSRPSLTPAVPSMRSSPRRVSAPVEAEDGTLPGYSEADDAELERARLQMSLEREQWARKVARVVATETDGRWVVLAGDQDGASLQVYRLTGARLVFVRNLFGHRSVVSALAVADGRCVSLGLSGEVWAWDLEQGTGVEVDGPSDRTMQCTAQRAEVHCTIAFDERRIWCKWGNEVQVRRFDY